MLRLVLLLAVAAPATPPAFALQAAPAPNRCAALAADFRGYEMDLAAVQAEAFGDDSAPRATLREARKANALAAAAITIDLMRDNRCPLPPRAPRQSTYLPAAVGCRQAILRSTIATNPAECNRETWQRAE